MPGRNMIDTCDDWIEHVINDVNVRGHYRGSTLEFEGNVLFKWSKPVARLLKGVDNQWLLLKDEGFWMWRLHNMIAERAIVSVSMQSIGVASQYAGKLEGVRLHNHVRNQLNGQMRHAVILAERMSTGRIMRGGADIYYGPNVLIRESLKNWEIYTKTLGLEWMPPLIDTSVQVQRIVDDRRDAYLQDEPRRQRAAARKQALVALGLAA